MAGSKQISEKNTRFVSGGGHKMSGKNTTGPQKSGVSSQEGASGEKFAKGGKTKMFGKQQVKPAKKE